MIETKKLIGITKNKAETVQNNREKCGRDFMKKMHNKILKREPMSKINVI